MARAGKEDIQENQSSPILFKHVCQSLKAVDGEMSQAVPGEAILLFLFDLAVGRLHLKLRIKIKDENRQEYIYKYIFKKKTLEHYCLSSVINHSTPLYWKTNFHSSLFFFFTS